MKEINPRTEIDRFGLSVEERFKQFIETADSRRIKYSTEFKKVWRKQAELLEELRELGVLGIIEETTGGVIFPLVVPLGYKASPGHLTEYQEQVWVGTIKPRMGSWWDGEWHIDTPFPYLKEDGSFEPALHIEVSQTRHDANLIKSIRVGSVLFTYTPRKKLIITGKEITFSGRLPKDDIKRLDAVKDAFTKALAKPMQGSDAAIFQQTPQIRFL